MLKHKVHTLKDKDQYEYITNSTNIKPKKRIISLNKGTKFLSTSEFRRKNQTIDFTYENNNQLKNEDSEKTIQFSSNKAKELIDSINMQNNNKKDIIFYQNKIINFKNKITTANMNSINLIKNNVEILKKQIMDRVGNNDRNSSIPMKPIVNNNSLPLLSIKKFNNESHEAELRKYSIDKVDRQAMKNSTIQSNHENIVFSNAEIKKLFNNNSERRPIVKDFVFKSIKNSKEIKKELMLKKNENKIVFSNIFDTKNKNDNNNNPFDSIEKEALFNKNSDDNLIYCNIFKNKNINFDQLEIIDKIE